MKRPILLSASALLMLLAFVSCAGTGEVLKLHVSAGQRSVEEMTEPPVGLKVAIRPFEDGRVESNRLGTRIGLLGGEEVFQLADGEPGEVVAQAMKDLLKGRGWQAELVKPNQPEPDADVILTGTIEELTVDAEGKLFRTAIWVRSKTKVEAHNTSDKSTVRMTVSGENSDEFFWFKAEHAQELLNEALTDSFTRFTARTKVEGNLLRLK